MLDGVVATVMAKLETVRISPQGASDQLMTQAYTQDGDMFLKQSPNRFDSVGQSGWISRAV